MFTFGPGPAPPAHLAHAVLHSFTKNVDECDFHDLKTTGSFSKSKLVATSGVSEYMRFFSSTYWFRETIAI